MLITGDFNTPAIDWRTLSVNGLNKVICDCLINMSISFDLTPIVNSVTRESSILDLVFINEQLRQNGYDCNIVEGL